MGGLGRGMEFIAGGIPGAAGPATAGMDVELHRELIDAAIDAGIDPFGLRGPGPPDHWDEGGVESILVSLPEGGTDWVFVRDLAELIAAGATIEKIDTSAVPPRPQAPATVEVPELYPEKTEPPPTIEELAGEPQRDLPTGAAHPSGTQYDTLQVLKQTGILGDAPMSWIDDLADIVGAVGNVVTAPIGTQGTILSHALGIDPVQPVTYASYAPGGGWNGVATPAAFDMPGVDVGRQGAISARGGPFYQGRTNLRTRRILQFTHPETGRIVWYRNMGRPILWSGDRSTVRRWNRNVGPSRRVGVSRRRKR